MAHFFPREAPAQPSPPNICVGYPVPPPASNSPNCLLPPSPYHQPHSFFHHHPSPAYPQQSASHLSTPAGPTPSANHCYPRHQQFPQPHMHSPQKMQNCGNPSQPPHLVTLPPLPRPFLSGYPQQQFPNQQIFPRAEAVQSCGSNGIAVGCPVMGFPVQAQHNPASSFLHHQQAPPQQVQFGHQEPVVWQTGAQAQLNPVCSNTASAFSHQKQPPQKMQYAQQEPVAWQAGPPVPQQCRGLTTEKSHTSSDGFICKESESSLQCYPRDRLHSTGGLENSTSKDSFPYQQLQQKSQHLNANSLDLPAKDVHPPFQSRSGGLYSSPWNHSKGSLDGRKSSHRPGPGSIKTGWGVSRGKSSTSLRARSEDIYLQCDSCGRNFRNVSQKEAHFATHVKCDEEGCTYEATGKLVKEHKVTEHGKICQPTKDAAVRAMHLRSKESQEEIKQWREERKRNYPTTANMERKAEETKARKARGELVDEDAEKRYQRIREVLSRQAELGLPVAEVPYRYISDCSNASQGQRKHQRKRMNETSHLFNGGRSHNCDSLNSELLEYPNSRQVLGEPMQEADLNARKDYLDNDSCRVKKGICHFFRRGFCKHGANCEFLHERKKQKNYDNSRNVSSETLMLSNGRPSLLSKLLESDIRKDKSHLLQCFRFMLNNHFFLEYPSKPLHFFEWVESSNSGSGHVVATDEQLSSVQGDKEVMVVDDNSTMQVPAMPESYKMGQNNCREVERTDSPDVWKVLQQRLLEDAGGMNV